MHRCHTFLQKSAGQCRGLVRDKLACFCICCASRHHLLHKCHTFLRKSVGQCRGLVRGKQACFIVFTTQGLECTQGGMRLSLLYSNRPKQYLAIYPRLIRQQSIRIHLFLQFKIFSATPFPICKTKLLCYRPNLCSTLATYKMSLSSCRPVTAYGIVPDESQSPSDPPFHLHGLPRQPPRSLLGLLRFTLKTSLLAEFTKFLTLSLVLITGAKSPTLIAPASLLV